MARGVPDRTAERRPAITGRGWMDAEDRIGSPTDEFRRARKSKECDEYLA
jgi:hypothetical protein